jgi:hypothetical protein
MKECRGWEEEEEEEEEEGGGFPFKARGCHRVRPSPTLMSSSTPTKGSSATIDDLGAEFESMCVPAMLRLTCDSI